MTMRDYFAAKAMQALIGLGSNTPTEHTCADSKATYDFPDSPYYFGDWEGSDNPDRCDGVDSLAVDAYMVADAMLKERTRNDEPS
jgi:hypothetical protein